MIIDIFTDIYKAPYPYAKQLLSAITIIIHDFNMLLDKKAYIVTAV